MICWQAIYIIFVPILEIENKGLDEN